MNAEITSGNQRALTADFISPEVLGATSIVLAVVF